MFRRVSTQLRPFAAANMATLCPKSSKFPKHHKGRVGGIAHQGTHISFGKYGLQALEPAWITAKQIESGRRAMVRSARRLWVRVFPDKPITQKPNETRMGRGKGNQAYWVAVVKPGKILYEMDAVSETVAKKAIAIAAAKMPIRTKFIATSVGLRRNYSTMGAGYLNDQGRKYSTTVPNDSDTHDDFKPTSKLESSGLSLKDIVEQDVKDNPVMIYMKGVPDLPRCGFSSLAVRVLNEYSIPVSARNILEDPELKDAVKAYSHWPTFPQIFIKGEFVGGSDIILSMHQSGELKEKLKDIAAANQDDQQE